MSGVIIGAGIGGLSTAIAMNIHDIDVKVFEAAKEISSIGAGILIPPNAMAILDRYNLEGQVRDAGIAIDSIDLVDLKGRVISETNTFHRSNGKVFQTVAIHRGKLQSILLNALPAGTVISNRRCVGIDSELDFARAVFEDNTFKAGKFLVGADGLHSNVRKSIFQNSSLRYSGQTCWRGVSDIMLSSQWSSRLTEIWGNGIRFGFVPISDSKVYWYATKVEKKGGSDSSFDIRKYLLTLFQRFLEPVEDIISNTPVGSIFRDDLLDLLPLESWFSDSTVLIGDAAHASTPNLGQGGAQAIEDSWFLAKALKNCVTIDDAFETFQKSRKNKAQKVVDVSWKIGKVTNLSNAMACHVRNTIFRCVPSFITRRQAGLVYDVKF